MPQNDGNFYSGLAGLVALLLLALLLKSLPSAAQQPAASAAATDSDDRERLLALRASFSNGAQVLHSWQGEPCTVPCNPHDVGPPSCSNWDGISCDNSTNRVYKISIPPLGLQGSLLAGGWDLPGQLTWLDLSYNSIQGSVADLRFPPTLKQAYMVGTGLGGSLPDAWQHPALETLWLANNSISGRLPTGWDMPSLYSLRLDGNALSGQLSPEVFPLPYGCSEVRLGSNLLTGGIPPLWNDTLPMETLETLDLHNNSLSGALPSWPTVYDGLSPQVYVLPGNHFCGEVPASPEYYDFGATDDPADSSRLQSLPQC